jgi:O-antigen ligase
MSNSKMKYDVFKKGVCYIFIVYWLVLVLWQNLGSASLRGTADTILKLALLSFLTAKFFLKSHYVKKKEMAIIYVFAITQMISLMLNDAGSFSFSLAVFYAFPTLFLFLTFGIGSRFCVSEKEIEMMNKLVIIVCLYAILYTIVFEPAQFIAAFSSKSGYGSELHAFFISMNEFAMYLFYGIVSCIMKIERLKNESTSKKLAYYVMLAIFLGVQILTFSRTSIIATLAFLIVYSVIFFKSKLSKKILICLLISLAIIVAVDPIRDYFFRTVFKSGKSNSRMKLLPMAIEFFKNGTPLQKLFGHGISSTREYFFSELTYGSVHNGYLQIILYYGVVGLTFLLAFLIGQFISIVRMFKKDRYVGVLSLSMLAYVVLTMFPSTLIIFSSSIDCFFLTSVLIILPKYMRNAVIRGCFYNEALKE